MWAKNVLNIYQIITDLIHNYYEHISQLNKLRIFYNCNLYLYANQFILQFI